jgi:hypothetical protein
MTHVCTHHSSKHRSSSSSSLQFWSNQRRAITSPSARSLSRCCQRIYRSLSLTFIVFLRLFIIVNRFIRTLTILLNKIHHVFALAHGWFIMLRTLISSIYLFVACAMNFIFKIYHIFYLLSILFEPLSKRTFDKAVRSFSHFIYEYYSSNGACYTLKARTRHIIRRVRARWKRTSTISIETVHNEYDVYYDAYNDEQHCACD